MAQVTITINAREYGIACEDGQERRIIQLAGMLDEKARMIAPPSGQISESMLLAMVGLLLADELTELRKGNPTATIKDEAVDNSRILEFDKSLAGELESLTKELKKLANEINLL